MTGARVRLAAAVIAGLASAGLVAQEVFRGGTDVVVLTVTVTNSESRLVSGLARDDFQVFEDGVPQDIAVFSREAQPIALSLLIDSSTSMDRKLDVAQQAAIGFVARLKPHDIAEIFDFNTRQERVQPFTTDKAALEQAIRKLQAGGSTTLYQALYVAMNDLRGVRAPSSEEIRHQAIVVLSDGEDTSSLQTYDDVLDQAKRSEVTVYAIGLRAKEASPAGHGFNEADFFLRQLTQETGGRVFFVNDVGQLSSVYGTIADELANVYTIGYRSKNLKRDGTWRKIAIRVSTRPAIARTKSGYFAATVIR
jgi:Ca-activated chloride channel homolog